jgi:hypothetical protein
LALAALAGSVVAVAVQVQMVQMAVLDQTVRLAHRAGLAALPRCSQLQVALQDLRA